MKTHRCKESLKQQVSIRYDKLFNSGNYETTWHLRQLDYNSEWDSYGLSIGIKIKYCPFCAERLEEF